MYIYIYMYLYIYIRFELVPEVPIGFGIETHGDNWGFPKDGRVRRLASKLSQRREWIEPNKSIKFTTISLNISTIHVKNVIN